LPGSLTQGVETPKEQGEPVGSGGRPKDRPITESKGIAPVPPQVGEETYTNRLLRAKKRLWEDRDQDESKSDS
jgi:hypothetical protein